MIMRDAAAKGFVTVDNLAFWAHRSRVFLMATAAGIRSRQEIETVNLKSVVSRFQKGCLRGVPLALSYTSLWLLWQTLWEVQLRWWYYELQSLNIFWISPAFMQLLPSEIPTCVVQYQIYKALFVLPHSLQSLQGTRRYISSPSLYQCCSRDCHGSHQTSGI